MASSTSHYIATALAQPRLEREEELRLARRYLQTGDRAAAETLVRAHLKQVVHVAMRYKGYGVSVPDLIAAGNFGLVRALDKFDPSRGLRFATYSEHWVRAFVVREMLRGRSVVRVGGRSLETDTFFKVRRDHARWVGRVGEHEAIEHLAEEYEMSEDEAAALVMRVSCSDASLNAPMSDERTATWIERIEDEQDSQELRVERAELNANYRVMLDEASRRFTKREQDILRRRLLAEEGEEASLADLGAEYGVSRERIRQIEVDLKHKLRARLAVRYRDLQGELLRYAG